MRTDVFLELCDLLKREGLLRATKNVTVEEQVAIFLNTVGHSERNRVMQIQFQHSGPTISKYFNAVLEALLYICPDYVKVPEPETPTPAHIASNRIFYPFFKDYIGVIDGTYVPAWVPIKDHQRYRCRKGFIAQNVMAAVGFDMLFQFVCAGFEGSANDQKVLSDVLQNRGIYNMQVPEGKYFLVDAGYAHKRGFIGPYRGTRYHLKEYGCQALAPRTSTEPFSLRHSKLQNVVERTFVLWKERFPILTHIPRNYPVKTQAKIVNACAVIHTFIMMRNPNNDELCQRHYHEVIYIDQEDNEDDAVEDESGSQYAYRLRDTIASDMWNASANRRASASQMMQ
ncbi:putative nuclease HARBI1 [Cinnamomum micranthum f. kanehirae]|uniref:Putative nuclease HARBI1 n=1 Tax=Cinnamomum micranthum f. kanehirae TaxID=337451 RepID=A0A3S4PUI0_9MAGN|nr:putative nuclease HARBI1 [Cinnamomum micranthum f. kanehirae]